MLIKKPADIRPSEITPPELYARRREFLKTAAVLGAAAILPPALGGRIARAAADDNLKPTPYQDVTTYNNYYEFGSSKSDPSENAGSLKTKPWTVTVEGHCEKPGQYALEDFLGSQTPEERIYRLRCVEAWSMVIPWQGVPLNKILPRFQPTANAKYVEFTTLLDPAQMPGQRTRLLSWPYVEGLRMDEAMHPLTLLVTGLYGKELPNQNGAPLRLIVPWKYGFKSVKAIVKVRFTEQQPRTTWSSENPDEYGFYANVNPAVDHPRWTQKKERRIGDLFRRDTLPFNGYAEQVAGLYAGMDLRKSF
ncbi:MAG: protein-methionine-sulfoxide reductase catalytic subunit MsrP [Candidatus Competibacteraceae bacterium]|nr:MAG: protein-methionine-sulfoxide reductase catalytic subunit MsrP [Candidatus Competibacteraceae bacterium]